MTMKFEELKNNIDSGVKIDKCGLEITKYLKLSEKIFVFYGTDEEPGLIDNILKKNEQGLWYVDRFAYEMHYSHILMNWFGNVTFDEFTVDTYDYLIEKGIVDYVSINIDDYKFTDMLNSILEDELSKRNSMQSVILQLGNKLIEKIDSLTDTDKMEDMMKLADDALVRYPFIKDILPQEFKQVKQATKKTAKGKSKKKV